MHQYKTCAFVRNFPSFIYFLLFQCEKIQFFFYIKQSLESSAKAAAITA